MSHDNIPAKNRVNVTKNRNLSNKNSIPIEEYVLNFTLVKMLISRSWKPFNDHLITLVNLW